MKTNPKIFRFLFWTAIAGLFAISSIPDIQPNNAGTFQDSTIRLDYLLHFIAYGVIGILFINSYPIQWKGILLLILFAIAEEGHQLWIPGRSFNPIDLLFDFIGLTTALVIYLLVKNFRTKS